MFKNVPITTNQIKLSKRRTSGPSSGWRVTFFWLSLPSTSCTAGTSTGSPRSSMRPTENAPSVLPPLKKRGLCNCFYEDFIEVQGCTNPVPFGFVADTQLISARIPKASEKKKHLRSCSRMSSRSKKSSENSRWCPTLLATVSMF